MNKVANLFIKTSLVYLAISAVLGVLITVGPRYSFMHSHFALMGWLSFLLFGLTYEIIPRFTGIPLLSEKLGVIQFWIGNIGLVGLALSYPFMRMSMLKGYDFSNAMAMVIIFGIIEAMSIFIFIYNVWKSMER